MYFTQKNWERMDFFHTYGYYDKMVATLKIIDRGGGLNDIFSYFMIEDPGSFQDIGVLEKKVVSGLLKKVFQFVEFGEGVYTLTPNGRTILENHHKGLVDYNRQVFFLYMSQNLGGFLNIFYALDGDEQRTRAHIMAFVNEKRSQEDFSPRKRWSDFTVRLVWLRELGLVKDYDDGTYGLTEKGHHLLKSLREKSGKSQASELTHFTTIDQYPAEYRDRIDGPLKKRRFGIRIDDDVIVYVVGGDTLRVVEGRVLRHRRALHLIDSEGYYHHIYYDWVTDIVIKNHNRPHPSDDDEYVKKTQKKIECCSAKDSEPKGLENVYL